MSSIINILLFLLLLILPDSIGCFIFLILVLRFVKWLFGAGQDMMDDYYYSRYERAKKKGRKERVQLPNNLYFCRVNGKTI